MMADAVGSSAVSSAVSAKTSGRIVVIGGDGAGMAAASQVRRLQPDAEIVVLEKGSWASYSACGIPYLIGGAVNWLKELVARSPEEFRAMRIDLRLLHEAVAIDLEARTVEVRNLERDRTFTMGFDQLHLATGAVPRRPHVPGIDLPHVFGVQTLTDAQAILAAVERAPRQVCVVGGGYIGLELAEAFLIRGAEVTVVDRAVQPMSSLDPDMGALVAVAMRKMGITVRTEETVLGIDEHAVTTEHGEIPAEVVILGTGVRPNTDMLAACGVPLGISGAVAVDRRQRTPIEGVYAAGDCCESLHLVSGAKVNIALGTHANKQGRVAGINLAGGYATFPGVVGTAVTKICENEIARTGCNQDEADAAGFAYVTASIDSTTGSRYMGDAVSPIRVKMLAERGRGLVLGVQIVGGPGSAKRIDVVATALSARMTVEDVLNLDLGYAPPLSSVWDPVAVAARAALGALKPGQ
jgi:NADPH-dependent 2,4-dienoyl-CoA reductase/sulfur reductase-like enzyme